MSLRIIASGGGSPVREGSSLFQAALDLSGREKPNVLLVTTPRYTQDAHDLVVPPFLEKWGKGAGLPVRLLHDFGTLPTPFVAAELLEWADVVQVTGGDSKHMMEEWKKGRLLGVIRRAVLSGSVVATGVSAGMLAWFA